MYQTFIYVAIFLIYSFIGWIVEVSAFLIQDHKFVNRGFFIGPVVPIYGTGGILITLLLTKYQSDPVTLFCMAVVVCSILEYFTSYVMEKLFHARWWDYSNKPLNFHGYICLEFSLIWGVAILLVVKVFQSFVEHHTSAHAPSIVGWMVVAILYALYLADLIVTVAVIQGLNRKLTRLDTFVPTCG